MKMVCLFPMVRATRAPPPTHGRSAPRASRRAAHGRGVVGGGAGPRRRDGACGRGARGARVPAERAVGPQGGARPQNAGAAVRSRAHARGVGGANPALLGCGQLAAAPVHTYSRGTGAQVQGPGALALGRGNPAL